MTIQLLLIVRNKENVLTSYRTCFTLLPVSTFIRTSQLLHRTHGMSHYDKFANLIFLSALHQAAFASRQMHSDQVTMSFVKWVPFYINQHFIC